MSTARRRQQLPQVHQPVPGQRPPHRVDTFRARHGLGPTSDLFSLAVAGFDDMCRADLLVRGVAADVGVPENTAKIWLRRGRQQLHEAFRDDLSAEATERLLAQLQA